MARRYFCSEILMGTRVSRHETVACGYLLLQKSSGGCRGGMGGEQQLELEGRVRVSGLRAYEQACGPLETNAGVPGVPSSIFCSETDAHGIHAAKFGLNYRLWPF
jgi:hypothetical protein